MGRLRILLNPVRWWKRWLVKGCLLLGVLLGVTYPNPVLLVRDVDHWSRLDTLPDGDAPGLDLMVDSARRYARVDGGGSAAELAAVERVVGEEVVYAWDWEVWGVVDYVPTVAEVIEKGREDCDGRAVLAAAMLRRMGYDAQLVSDLSHVWVWTPEGEAMGPRRTESGYELVETTEEGVDVDWRAVWNVDALMRDLPGNLAFGVSVFPPGREIAVLLALWLVLLRREARWGRELGALVLLVCALVLLRAGGATDLLMGAWAGIGLGLLAGAVAVGGDPRHRGTIAQRHEGGG